MLMVGAESIRDVIAFQNTICTLFLSEAPGSVPDDSLEELHIKKIEE